MMINVNKDFYLDEYFLVPKKKTSNFDREQVRMRKIFREMSNRHVAKCFLRKKKRSVLFPLASSLGKSRSCNDRITN